jgi:shikimate kinase
VRVHREHCSYRLHGFWKSTTGRILAERLGWPFIDIDREIESVHARSALSLFRELGEVKFRAAEAEIMAKCLALPTTVVALGGAAVDLLENQRLLREHYTGLLVFLDGPFDVLIERCLEEAGNDMSTYRPLLHLREKAFARFESRRDWNRTNAGMRVDVSSQSCEEAATEIARHISF